MRKAEVVEAWMRVHGSKWDMTIEDIPKYAHSDIYQTFYRMQKDGLRCAGCRTEMVVKPYEETVLNENFRFIFEHDMMFGAKPFGFKTNTVIRPMCDSCWKKYDDMKQRNS